jgi:hypothetical protein
MHIISHTSKRSESVTRLLEALGKEDAVLNYGCGVDKITQYKYFKENNIPAVEWTIDYVDARLWLEAGHTVMARTKTKGQAGSGLFVVSPPTTNLHYFEDEVKAFTKYISHKREFRVNLFKHKLVNVREKKKKVGFKGGDFHIRNLANGYTTAKCSSYPTQIVALAEQASLCSGSDFIGVDVGYNELKDFAFVIEVNSGPSIEGSSVQDFVKAIQDEQA